MEIRNVKSDKIILLPYAERVGANTGANISKIANRQEVYLKNCCVSACSAKQSNPECDVAVVSNIDIPENYTQILEQNGVLIIKIPFDVFCFEDSYVWSLAFYKLCVLFHMVREWNYGYYAYMDTDVYVQGSLDSLWEECDQNIMLYDINHGLQVKDYRILMEEVEAFLGKRRLITHYGGEFVAANRDRAIAFSEKCLTIYREMVERGFTTTKGDEFILSVAADEMKIEVKNAGAYIYRFWTGSFRLVSTCYENNAVSILHVPAEKECGMIKLYDRYVSKGKKVRRGTLHRVLNLKRQALPLWVKFQIRKVWTEIKCVGSSRITAS